MRVSSFIVMRVCHMRVLCTAAVRKRSMLSLQPPVHWNCDAAYLPVPREGMRERHVEE